MSLSFATVNKQTSAKSNFNSIKSNIRDGSSGCVISVSMSCHTCFLCHSVSKCMCIFGQYCSTVVKSENCAFRANFLDLLEHGLPLEMSVQLKIVSECWPVIHWQLSILLTCHQDTAAVEMSHHRLESLSVCQNDLSALCILH